jgi:general secretion pathway protein J
MRMRRDTGLTLLELTVVMAIFSLVAVIALQALSGAIAARGRVAASSAETADLAVATALLRRDLQAMVPLPVGERGMAFSDSGDEIVFVAAGQFDLPEGDRSGPAQVSWSVGSNGRLLRTRQVPGAAPNTMVIMTGVTGWEVRSLYAGGTWQEESAANPAAARDLPRAVEVRFAAEGIGGIRVLVAR